MLWAVLGHAQDERHDWNIMLICVSWRYTYQRLWSRCSYEWHTAIKLCLSVFLCGHFWRQWTVAKWCVIYIYIYIYDRKKVTAVFKFYIERSPKIVACNCWFKKYARKSYAHCIFSLNRIIWERWLLILSSGIVASPPISVWVIAICVLSSHLLNWNKITQMKGNIN